MKKIEVKIVQSSTYVLGVSIRSLQYDDIRPELRKAGFRPSDRAIIVDKESFDELIRIRDLAANKLGINEITQVISVGKGE